MLRASDQELFELGCTRLEADFKIKHSSGPLVRLTISNRLSISVIVGSRYMFPTPGEEFNFCPVLRLVGVSG